MNPDIVTRPHSDERFPRRITKRTASTHNTWQGREMSCVPCGCVTAIELMDPSGSNLSPMFVYYFMLPGDRQVERCIATINRVGTCLEALHPYMVDSIDDYVPGVTELFAVRDLGKPPSLAALVDARDRGIKGFAVAQVTDQWAFMRSLCQGSSLILNKLIGGGAEHVICSPGYDGDDGMEVLDNGISNESEFYPWEALGRVVSQAWRFTESPFPFVVHPDYSPPTPAHFENGVLTCPFIQALPPYDPTDPMWWMKPRLYYKNVVVHFDGELNETNTKVNDGDISGMDALWKPRGEGVWDDRLELPIVDVGGTVLRNVSVTGVPIRLISFEKDES